jgi:acetyl esterase/lipase
VSQSTLKEVMCRYEEAPAVGGLWTIPRTGDGNSAIMYLYGGGYVISSPHSRRKTAGHLANASGAHVLVPRYELAPEHPFHAAVHDAAALTGGCWKGDSVRSRSSLRGIRVAAA